MRKYIFLILTLLFTYSAFSQKDIPEFGKITLNELQLQSCPFEPEAEAMKLFDVTEAEFEYNQYGSKTKTEKRVRIKVFKEGGYKYASIRIPYFSKKSISKIKDLKGIIYNLDDLGNIVIQKLEKDDFFKKQSDKHFGIVNFTFPNLKPGSVIEFSYTRVEHDILQLDAWDVQDIIPSLYVSNTIIIPTESRLKEKIYGIDTIQQIEQKFDGNRVRHIYYKENVSSFRTEPYMTSFRDNLLRVAYLLIPKVNFFIDAFTAPDRIWEIAGRQLLHSRVFGGQIVANIPGTDSLVEAAKKIQSVGDRIQFLFQAVKKQSPDRVEQALMPSDITEAWKNKTGTTSELNLILINLLRKANVQCYPLLVSTRSHGKIITNFPSTSQFNGLDVLAVDSERVYFLDVSIKGQSSSTPPANVLNRLALLLNEERIRWIQIEDTRPLLKQDVSIQACLNDDGTLLGNAITTSYDYAKMALLDSTDEDVDESKVEKLVGYKIFHQKIVQAENDDAPLMQHVAFEYQPQKTGDFYFVKPQFFMPLKQNPFIKETRNTDIDFGCNQQLTLTLNIELLPNQSVEFMPKNMVVRAPDSSFFYKRMCTKTDANVSYTQTFEIKRSLVYREDYKTVREFFAYLYKLMGEELIFKQKK